MSTSRQSLDFAEGEGLQDSDNEREDITNTEILFQRPSKGRGITETNDYIKCNVPSLTDQYPCAKSLEPDSALSFVPVSLQTLLNCLFVGKETSRKVAAIGQAIVQAVRQHAVVAPIRVDLAVQAHHLYQSRFPLWDEIQFIL